MRAVHYELDVRIDLFGGVLQGTARIRLRNNTSEPCPASSFLLNRLLVPRPSAGLHGSLVAMEDLPSQQVVQVIVEWPRPIEPGDEATAEIAFSGGLGDYAATGMAYIRDRIDPDFTILRPDAFAWPVPGSPSHRALRAAGLPTFEWSARIDVPRGFEVACGGRLSTGSRPGERTEFRYRSVRPSWRMDFAIARYGILEEGGHRVCHFPPDLDGARRLLRAVGGAFGLYESWFGPRSKGLPFSVIEIPDGWGSQADVTCILQTAAAFRDPSRLVEVYHELAHLFDVPCLDPHPPRWNEGLAMFLMYRVADHLDGSDRGREAEERARSFLRDAIDLDPRIRQVPMARYGEEGMTDRSYQVGLLMFGALFRRIGPESFDRIFRTLRSEHDGRGVTTEEFARHAAEVSSGAATPVLRDWLFTTAWCDSLAGPR